MPSAMLGDVGAKTMETWSCPQRVHSLVSETGMPRRVLSWGQVLGEGCTWSLNCPLKNEWEFTEVLPKEGRGKHKALEMGDTIRTTQIIKRDE